MMGVATLGASRTKREGRAVDVAGARSRWRKRPSRAPKAKLDKTRLLAPVDGTVRIRVAEPGEITAPGKSVMTLNLDGSRWFAFTLREDRLHGLTIGATAALTTNDGRRFDACVLELSPLGEFATWRAARVVGDHDLNSFRVRLEPVADSGQLEPGMTVWLDRQ